MLLRLLQRHGHRPVVLMGGGTTRIGDPSGKDESRQLLTDARHRRQHGRHPPRASSRSSISATAPPAAVMANNADWLDGLGYIPLLRDVGVHFSVNRMLGFDSVRLRLEREQPLTFLEFNYMILQAYDFRELYRRHGVRLQMGGSDQWGNIVSGIDLVRRTDRPTVFGLTTPLITTASGAKMGKTARGAVWLTADRLTPLRLLAVLAQRRGRRCRPVPAPVHRPAAGRDRAAGGAGRGGDQRGEEDSRHRGDGARAWARGGGRSGGDGADDIRGGRGGRGAAERDGEPRGARGRNTGVPPVRAKRGSPRRAAMRAA